MILHHLLDNFRNRSRLFVPACRQGLFFGTEFNFYVFCGNEMPNLFRFKLDYIYLTRRYVRTNRSKGLQHNPVINNNNIFKIRWGDIEIHDVQFLPCTVFPDLLAYECVKKVPSPTSGRRRSKRHHIHVYYAKTRNLSTSMASKKSKTCLPLRCCR